MSATTQFTPITIGSSNSNGKAQNQGTNLGERIDWRVTRKQGSKPVQAVWREREELLFELLG